MKKRPPPESIVRARYLRRDMTEAEQRMWRMLRECFAGARFRRQVPIRHYITDFARHRHRLVIEIDGCQHDARQDAVRTAVIENEGYRVIRFWNNEVLQNREGCMTQLAALLGHDHPLPASTSTRFGRHKSLHPSPIKGEGQ